MVPAAMKILAFLLSFSLAAATEVKLEPVPEHGVQPQVAVTADGAVHLVYLTGEAGGADVRYSHRGANDTAWSAPITVNSTPHSAVAMGTIRGAQLALGKSGSVHVVWNGAAEKGKYATAPLCYTRLENGVPAPQRTLNTGTINLDGGASIAADGKGGVFVVWHASPPEGKSEADRRIYLCRSQDDGASFTAAAPAKGAPPGVCPCCSLKTLAGADGVLRVLFRNASAKSQRDMTLLESRDSAVTFTAKPVHPWPIAACPMSNAALLSSGKTARAAWETDGTVFTATLTGKLEPLALSAGQARHPALAINSRGETLVTWSIGTGWQRGGELGWVLLDAAGKPTATRGTAPGVPVWGHTAAFANAAGDFILLH